MWLSGCSSSCRVAPLQDVTVARVASATVQSRDKASKTAHFGTTTRGNISAQSSADTSHVTARTGNNQYGDDESLSRREGR